MSEKKGKLYKKASKAMKVPPKSFARAAENKPHKAIREAEKRILSMLKKAQPN